MADVATAQAMITYYSERPPSIRGCNAYVQFSNHEELKTEKTPQVISTIYLLICNQFLVSEWVVNKYFYSFDNFHNFNQLSYLYSW